MNPGSENFPDPRRVKFGYQQYEQESVAKVSAEASCAQALKALEKAQKELEDNKAALEDFKAGEKERLQEAAKASMNTTIEKLRKNVEEVKGQCRQQGMKQGFTLGYTQDLIATAVPKGTTLWELPVVPDYIDPDVEMSKVPKGGGDDDADADAISKPTPASGLQEPIPASASQQPDPAFVSPQSMDKPDDVIDV